MNEIQSAIAKACETTQPQTKERNKALKSVKWVLKCTDGNGATKYGALCGLECALVDDVKSAQVFDGRDNEVTKAKFWGIQLLQSFTPSLI